MKHREAPVTADRPSEPQPQPPLPAGFLSFFLGSFRRSLESARNAADGFCRLSAGLSLVALAGWASGFPFLTRGHPASGPLSAPAAFCFLILALALYNHNRDPLSRRAKVILVVAALLSPLLATVDAGRLFQLALPEGLAAAGIDGSRWTRWSGYNPYTWASLCWLSLAMVLCPLFAGRRHWGGDVLGVLVLFLILINGIIISGYLHQAPLGVFSGENRFVPFLGCVNMLLLGSAVLARLGPRYFPVRFLSGSSVRAVILRHFLPVAGAAVLVLDVLNGESSGSGHLVLSSFLVLLLSLIAVVYLSLRSADVIGHRIESSLKESEERYAVLVESLKDYAVLLLDPDGRILTWNVGAKKIFGYEAENVLGDPVSRFYPPEERESGKMRGIFEEAVLRGSFEDQGWRVRKEGPLFWAEAVTTPFFGVENVVLGFSQVLRDITSRKNAQDTLTASLREKEALLKEIHHRVKNNLQMISSLLRLQSENIHDPALLAVFQESQNRVRSMAIIHECLYQSPDIGRMDFPDYVEKLTDSLLRTYSVHPEKNTIHLNVDEVSLNLDVAIPCGLIITELVSNALKYAYPEGKEGAVYVHFRSLPGNRHELTVADEGVGLKGPVDFESSQSLGLRLVHILTEQLRGRLRVENGVGAKFTVTF